MVKAAADGSICGRKDIMAKSPKNMKKTAAKGKSAKGKGKGKGIGKAKSSKGGSGTGNS